MVGFLFLVAVLINLLDRFVLKKKGLFVVKEQTVVIIERMGKFHRTCPPGIHFMFPVLDRKRPFLDNGKMVDYVDLRERTLEIPRQRLATANQEHVDIDIVVSYSISDPIKAVYSVEDLSAAIRQRSIVEFRDVIHTCTSTDIDTKREVIIRRVCERIQDTSDEWGIIIHRVVLQHTAFV